MKPVNGEGNPFTVNANASASPSSASLPQPAAVGNSAERVSAMTLREKIGQKIMLDFRYWNEDSEQSGQQDMVVINEQIARLIADHHIGGVILFANNLKNQSQIAQLTAALSAIPLKDGIGLFIATDNEGGNVFRLPRGQFASFAGNMALGAAYEGSGDSELAYRQGLALAQDMRTLGLNTNFAPVLDVNSNQSNPVINVRAFGDDPQRVSLLGRRMARGLADGQVVSCAKHFPGHGDTEVDSHLGLPRVNRSRQQALDIDLAPYRDAIAAGEAPDMIMTAHIQYPSLDDTRVKNRRGEEIILPATLSRKIQTDLLRGELGYKGVTITDALDMNAIGENFDAGDAIRQTFAAGIDIALMPISINRASDASRLEQLIATVCQEIDAGLISPQELDSSVARIVELKRRRNILAQTAPPAAGRIEEAKRIEKAIADKSITLLKNMRGLLPLRDKAQSLLILTPWREQGEAIGRTLGKNGFTRVNHAKTADLPWDKQQQSIQQCDILIMGSLSTSVSPVEYSGEPTAVAQAPEDGKVDEVRRAMAFAKAQGKPVIHITLRAPYDAVSYDSLSDAVLATYAYYGFDQGEQRGVSLNSAAEVMIGKLAPLGRLPVNIYNIDSLGQTTDIKFPRGYGLNC